MSGPAAFRRVLKAVHHYAVFFLLMAFVITCCMMLFVSTLSRTMGLTLTEENLQAAAKLTFANVVLLSLLCTVIDGVRRKFTFDRPVKRITDAARKLMNGVQRACPPGQGDREDGLNPVIDCFNAVAEELSGTETLRTDFVANVSHELKTPLAVMHNYAVMLRKPGLPEEERLEYAGAIADASRRLADLITNILRLNKLENQQIFPNAEEYDLSEQVCRCLLGYEDVWEQKDLNIETDIDDGVMICSDSELLSLVWNNLFSNAMKFTPPGGTVSVSVKGGEGQITVKVSDTGCGISKEVGERMFDQFYQGDTSHSAQGNGLGLALVRRVIDITGSDISVESEVGKGSTFTVRMRREPGG